MVINRYYSIIVILILWSGRVNPQNGNQENARDGSYFSGKTAQITCTQETPNGCNLITNNNDFIPNISNYDYSNPFGLLQIPGWFSSHGTPQINFIANPAIPEPPTPATNFAVIWSANNPSTGIMESEGIVQNIPPLQVGSQYALSFFKYFFDPYGVGSMDKFYVVLMHCSDAGLIQTGNFTAPNIPVNSQIIYCEQNLSNTSWQQVMKCFTANDDYDMIWIVPRQTTLINDLSYIFFAFPELVRISNFTAGPTPNPVYPECEVTIGPTIPNCGVANAEFYWTGPNGENVPVSAFNQQIQIDASTSSGTWTLHMEIPDLALVNNSCSNDCTILNSVSVPLCVCNPGSLQIQNPAIQYWNFSSSGTETRDFVQNLSNCDDNYLCYVKHNGDDLFYFTATSSFPTGNIWQARIVSVSPFTYGGGPNGLFNGNPIPYPYSGSYYTFSTRQNASLDIVFPSSEVYIIEIRLVNTVANDVKTMSVQSVPLSGPGPSDFYCVQTSSVAPYPHKVIFGVDYAGNPMDIPGFTYQWTFPTGMIMLTPTDNIHVEWDDTNFDYQTNPNPIATLHVSNIYGCGDYDISIPIAPSNCIPARSRMDIRVQESGTSTTVFPNPVTTVLQLKSTRIISSIVITTIDGRVLRKESLLNNRQINIRTLESGTYLVIVNYSDHSKETKIIVKQ